MNVSLTPELEQYVNGKVQSGMYRSASEVIREGLRLLKEREDARHHELEELRRAVQVGVDQADQGRTQPLTAELADDIKKRGRARLNAREGRS